MSTAIQEIADPWGNTPDKSCANAPHFMIRSSMGKNSETRATFPEKIPIDSMAPSERVRSSPGKGPIFP